MIFVDANILIYLESPQNRFFQVAFEAVVSARKQGPLAINSIVFAELAREYASADDLSAYLDQLDILHLPSTEIGLHAAARAFKAYRAAGGPRERILPDFFIGADAMVAGAPLLTNDPLLYETYFPRLSLITP